ncbi:MAG: TIR domain-containing protein [Lachnospiraceae bacterium]
MSKEAENTENTENTENMTSEPQTEAQEFMYDAFISYRHAPLDMYVAERLHKALESFRVPKLADKETKKRGESGIKRIFRDRDELPLAGNLSDPIMEALSSSEYLIVICSPRILESLWCQREIETFIKLRGIEHVFAVLIEGEPEDSFPKQLCTIPKEIVAEDGTTTVEEIAIEPLAADVRGKNKSEINKKIKSELLRLVAPMIGCSYDDLRQRHKMRRLKRMMISAAVIGGACFLFGAYSTYQSVRIRHQSQQIQAQSEEIMQKSEEIRAQSEEIEAQAQDLLAWQSESLSETALELYESGDRMTALMVALEGVPEDLDHPDRPIVAASEAALGEILEVYANAREIKPYYAFQHDTTTKAMTISPDGTRLVVSDNLHQLYCWDVENGVLLKKIALDDPEATHNIYFNADNKLIYNGENIVCMNPDDFSKEYEIGDITCLSLVMSKDLTMFATITAMNEVRVYDALDGDIIVSVQLEGSWMYGDDVFFSEDGTKVIFASDNDANGNKHVSVWDIANGEIVQEYSFPCKWIKDLCYLESGECYIIVAPKDITEEYVLYCYAPDGSLRWKASSDVMYGPICDFGEYIAYTGGDNLNIRNKSDGELRLFYDYNTYIISIKSVPQSNLIEIMFENGVYGYHYFDGENELLRCYMPETSDLITDMIKKDAYFIRQSNYLDTIYLYKTAFGSQGVREENLDGYYNVIEVENGKLLLINGDEVALYDEDAEEFLYHASLLDQENAGYQMFGDKIAIVGESGIDLIDIMTGELINRLDIEYRFYWVHNENNIYICDYMNDICYVYSASDLSQIACYQDICFQDAVVSDDGKYLVAYVNMNSNDIRLDLDTGEVTELDTFSTVMAKAPDGEHYLYADRNSRSLVYANIEDQTAIQVMSAQADFIESVGFSTDGSLFYVYYKDEKLVIYDTNTFKALKEYKGMSTITGWEDGLSQNRSVLRGEYVTDDSYVLNEDLEIVYTINGLIGYTSGGRIYAYNSKYVYSYPVYDLQMLVEEALAVLNGRQLTPEEMEKYRIE